MARRNEGLVEEGLELIYDVVRHIPWWMGLAVCLVVWLMVNMIIAALLPATSSQLSQTVMKCTAVIFGGIWLVAQLGKVR